MMFGLVITFAAVLNTFGDTANNEYTNAAYDEEILERAYADVTIEDFEVSEIENIQTIKVYDTEDNLLETIELAENEVISDLDTQSLMNRAEFLSEYNNTSIYRISK